MSYSNFFMILKLLIKTPLQISIFGKSKFFKILKSLVTVLLKTPFIYIYPLFIKNPIVLDHYFNLLKIDTLNFTYTF